MRIEKGSATTALSFVLLVAMSAIFSRVANATPTKYSLTCSDGDTFSLVPVSYVLDINNTKVIDAANPYTITVKFLASGTYSTLLGDISNQTAIGTCTLTETVPTAPRRKYEFILTSLKVASLSSIGSESSASVPAGVDQATMQATLTFKRIEIHFSTEASDAEDR